jgi:hypothetical protein
MARGLKPAKLDAKGWRMAQMRNAYPFIRVEQAGRLDFGVQGMDVDVGDVVMRTEGKYVHFTAVDRFDELWDWTPDAAPCCSVCGCTDDDACEDGCWWVKPNLCSACEDKQKPGLDADQEKPCPTCKSKPGEDCFKTIGRSGRRISIAPRIHAARRQR